MRTKMLRTG